MSDSHRSESSPAAPGSSAPAEASRPGVKGFLAARFGALVDRLTETLDRLAADALDEEAVHDARVACRRLRVGLAIVRPRLGRKKRTRRLGERLSALRSVLGAARETEVGQVTLRSLGARLQGDEKLAADALAAFLAVRHGELRRAAADQLAELDMATLCRRLAKCVTRLSRRGAVEVADGADPVPGAAPAAPDPLGTLALSAVRRRREAWLALPIEPLAAGEDAALHRARIEGKKLRYALEFFEPLFVAQVSTRLRLLRQLQDRLGEAHDLADLGARLLELARAARRLGDGRLVIGYEALAALVAEMRGERLRGFARLRAGVAHAGFLPALRSVAGGAVGGGSGESTAPEASEVVEAPGPDDEPGEAPADGEAGAA